MRFEDILTSRVDKVVLVDRWGAEGNCVGTLHVTTSHIIFKAEERSKELWLACGLIANVERGPLTVAGSSLIIKCKHFLQIHLLINRDKVCQDLFDTLLKCSRPVNVAQTMAFDHRDVAEDARGWSRLDWEIEFSRQGVSEQWKETDLNAEYKSCDTYPPRLWVPAAAHATTLMGSCRFRSRGRLPVLTYFNKANGAALARCAQPLTGFSARCVEDEKLMELIGKANPHTEQLYLVDTRPRVNAMVNKVQGKGFEDKKNYQNMIFHFFDIENIHVMRSSQQRLIEATSKCRLMTEYLRSLEVSGWLKHLRALTECGVFLAQSLVRGISCVVHCSDGWDRTSQTVSLAQLLLDPFFRTIHGFEVLIEKDWLGFGHKFDDRCAHVGALNDEAAKEVSPIFSQWLDCVWQIWQQRPRAFQFNERFLIEIHEHVYGCQYGTFLGNCDKDREDLKLTTRTKSLWTYLDSRQDDYLNPYYEPTSFGALVDIDTRAAVFSVWNGLYNRYDIGVLPREDFHAAAMISIEHIGVLEAQINQMRTKIAELKQKLGKGGMVDSGHGSSNGTEIESTSNMFSSCTDESGYCEDGPHPMSFRWQSTRDASHCASRSCGFEFPTRGERRIHCHRCGKIFCGRCVQITAEKHERVCIDCGELDK